MIRRGRGPLALAALVLFLSACAGAARSIDIPRPPAPGAVAGRAPTILNGALDDWTPAPPCAHLRERSAGARYPIDVTIYPGAHHSFDFPGARAINQWGKTREHDPAATADAERRVDAFLRGLFGAPAASWRLVRPCPAC